MKRKLLSALLALSLTFSLSAAPAAALTLDEARQLLRDHYVDQIPESVLSLEEENASGVTFRAKQLGRALITCQVSLPDGTTGEAYCTVLVLFDH